MSRRSTLQPNTIDMHILQAGCDFELFFVDKSGSEIHSKKAELCKFLKFYALSDETKIKKIGQTVIRPEHSYRETFIRIFLITQLLKISR